MRCRFFVCSFFARSREYYFSLTVFSPGLSRPTLHFFTLVIRGRGFEFPTFVPRVPRGSGGQAIFQSFCRPPRYINIRGWWCSNPSKYRENVKIKSPDQHYLIVISELPARLTNKIDYLNYGTFYISFSHLLAPPKFVPRSPTVRFLLGTCGWEVKVTLCTTVMR